MNKVIANGLLFLLLLLPGCSKDIDDKLEGKWQIQETEVDGVKEKTDTIFYNFQSSYLFMYQIYDKHSEAYFHIYGHKTMKENNAIYLEMTTPIDSVSPFVKRTDWDTWNKHFTVEKVTGKQLVLSSDGKRYTFRKY